MSDIIGRHLSLWQVGYAAGTNRDYNMNFSLATPFDMTESRENSHLSPEHNGLVSAVERIVTQRLQGQTAGHGIDHIQRVVRNALQIQADAGGNLLVILLAAWLHDVGDAKFCDGVERSAQFSHEILTDLQVPPFTIEQVVHIVDNISFRKAVDPAALSHEAHIVQDADRLDALGAIGIVRTIEYGASCGQPFFDPDSDVATSRTGVGHFYQKLFKLVGLLNTSAARRIAHQREQFMRDFLQQYFAECDYHSRSIVPIESQPARQDRR